MLRIAAALIFALASPAFSSSWNGFGSPQAACKDAIGTGGFYVFSHIEAVPGMDGSYRCYSKPKEGKGEPSLVTIVHMSSDPVEPGKEAAEPPPASTPTPEAAAEDDDLPQERERGKRFRRGQEQDQAEGIEKAKRGIQKERRGLTEKGGEWEDDKPPKQQRIFNDNKSKQRAKKGAGSGK
jgi:hypothetical protein